MARIKKGTTVEDTVEDLFQKKTAVRKKGLKRTDESAGATIEKKMRKTWKILISAIILGAVLSLGGTTVYFYHQYRKAIEGKNLSSTEQASIEAQMLKTKVSQLMELPLNEEPILATVTDVEKVKTQEFFASSQNGDKVLIYKQNKKAILYRPAINKIINVTSSLDLKTDTSTVSGADNVQVQPAPVIETDPVVDQTEAEAEVPADSADLTVEKRTEPRKVAIYNGSETKGLAAELAREIAEISGIEVVLKTNATDNYETTFVADLNGENTALVEKIAQAVGGTVGVFPENEKIPEADILIIGGGN